MIPTSRFHAPTSVSTHPSIDFQKKLLELAREDAQAEKDVVPQEETDEGEAALTVLFKDVEVFDMAHSYVEQYY